MSSLVRDEVGSCRKNGQNRCGSSETHASCWACKLLSKLKVAGVPVSVAPCPPSAVSAGWARREKERREKEKNGNGERERKCQGRKRGGERNC